MTTKEQLARQVAIIEEMESFGVPAHCRPGLAAYLIIHRPIGSFLTALLENNLRLAVGRADHLNASRFKNYVRFLLECAPGEAWGSPENVKAWLAKEKEND